MVDPKATPQAAKPLGRRRPGFFSERLPRGAPSYAAHGSAGTMAPPMVFAIAGCRASAGTGEPSDPDLGARDVPRDKPTARSREGGSRAPLASDQRHIPPTRPAEAGKPSPPSEPSRTGRLFLWPASAPRPSRGRRAEVSLLGDVDAEALSPRSEIPGDQSRALLNDAVIPLHEEEGIAPEEQ